MNPRLNPSMVVASSRAYRSSRSCKPHAIEGGRPAAPIALTALFARPSWGGSGTSIDRNGSRSTSRPVAAGAVGQRTARTPNGYLGIKPHQTRHVWFVALERIDVQRRGLFYESFV